MTKQTKKTPIHLLQIHLLHYYLSAWFGGTGSANGSPSANSYYQVYFHLLPFPTIIERTAYKTLQLHLQLLITVNLVIRAFILSRFSTWWIVAITVYSWICSVKILPGGFLLPYTSVQDPNQTFPPHQGQDFENSNSNADLRGTGQKEATEWNLIN